jgi:hypothetical protein
MLRAVHRLVVPIRLHRPDVRLSIRSVLGRYDMAERSSVPPITSRQVMADAKDVAAAIQSALDEIGVTGELDVTMDGKAAKKPLGSSGGDDVHIDVVVEPVDEAGERARDRPA